MSVSTFPAAKAYLVGKYQAATDLAGVQVDYGVPRSEPEREHVFLGGTGDDGQDWVALGNLGAGDRDETYGIQFWVHVYRPGDSQQEATERAHVLFGAIETVTRAELANADRIVTLPAFVWNLSVRPTGVTEYVMEEGRACLISGEIEVSARI